MKSPRRKKTHTRMLKPQPLSVSAHSRQGIARPVDFLRVRQLSAMMHRWPLLRSYACRLQHAEVVARVITDVPPEMSTRRTVAIPHDSRFFIQSLTSPGSESLKFFAAMRERADDRFKLPTISARTKSSGSA
jgi:hypothetical protein